MLIILLDFETICLLYTYFMHIYVLESNAIRCWNTYILYEIYAALFNRKFMLTCKLCPINWNIPKTYKRSLSFAISWISYICWNRQNCAIVNVRIFTVYYQSYILFDK